MAVTNAHVLAAVEALAAKLEEVQPASFNSEEIRSELSSLRVDLYNREAKSAGDSTETIRLLGSVNERLANLEYVVDKLASQPRAEKKTWRQRYDEFMNTLIGTNPAR